MKGDARMTEPMSTRRQSALAAMVGAAAAFSSGAGARHAVAQPIVAAIGNAGHYRFRVGDIAATVLSDGVIGGPPRVYAIDAPEEELRAALSDAFRPATWP
jgi:hypothetical protein